MEQKYPSMLSIIFCKIISSADKTTQAMNPVTNHHHIEPNPVLPCWILATTLQHMFIVISSPLSESSGLSTLDCLKMPFTPEQDAFILMAHFRSGTRNPNGSWSYSIQSCIEQYFEAFPEDNIPYPVFKNHRLVLIKRYEEKHCICKGKSTGRPTILTENVVDDIRHRMSEALPNLFHSYLPKQYSINYELVPLQALNPVKHIFDILSSMLSYCALHHYIALGHGENGNHHRISMEHSSKPKKLNLHRSRILILDGTENTSCPSFILSIYSDTLSRDPTARGLALLAPNMPVHAPSDRAGSAIFGRRYESRHLSVNQHGSKELGRWRATRVYRSNDAARPTIGFSSLLNGDPVTREG
ncbi:hypothetical protein NQ317_011187 [Molorchus minor]|uniref:Uncharacterized protein n=1 Tax=Molorchus minor TaxID=1323400 RepID=A0ABQ9IVP9_9CUCU|nr:hypothetical protein NQ317_011187 [Molorchus minor]